MQGASSVEPLSNEDTMHSFTVSLKISTAHKPMLASAGDEGHVDEYRQNLIR